MVNVPACCLIRLWRRSLLGVLAHACKGPGGQVSVDFSSRALLVSSGFCRNMANVTYNLLLLRILLIPTTNGLNVGRPLAHPSSHLYQ